MKKILFFTAAAALLAACSSDDLTVQEQPQAQLEEGAVGFDAYLQRSTTRAGYSADDMKLTPLQTYGFGVFGYYTDNRDYDQLAMPNFMYNTHVSTAAWTYSPIMYWPNEYGNSAISDDADKVTFFAYAPYVKVTPSTGKPDVLQSDQDDFNTAKTAYESAKTMWLTSNRESSDWNDWQDAKDDWKTAQETYYAKGGGDLGITGMTRNTTAGDPIIKYIGSFEEAQSVDLLWGVCQQSDWQIVEGGQAQNMGLGKPWIDVQRPAATNQKLKFQFMHALAKMQITVDEFNDDYKLNGTVDGKTRIWIRSVRFTGFTMKGALNLNNEAANTPYWMNYNGIGDLVADDDLTVFDGRKDAKEGVSGATATNEKVLGLNEQFIETEGCFNYSTPTAITWRDAPMGVNNVATPLFEGGGIFYVIPTGDKMQIEIVYDVETIDHNLGTYLADGKTPGSNIENRIWKTIEFGNGVNTLESGKAYDIKLHLGMNSVKFDAEVVDWDAMAAPDIDLPANMPQYAATTTTGKMDIPGANTTAYFAVTGLKGGEAVTVTSNYDAKFTTFEVNSTSKFTGTGDGRANASGVVYIKATVTPNTGITDIKQNTSSDPIVISVTGALTTTVTKITVVQKAQPLAMAGPTGTDLKEGKKNYVLHRTPATPELADWLPASTDETPVAAVIKVWCDGAELAVTPGTDITDGPTGAGAEGKVNFDQDSGTLWFASNRTAGQVIKVYIKAGDVPAETISFEITD